jgi:hypothetical protein
LTLDRYLPPEASPAKRRYYGRLGLWGTLPNSVSRPCRVQPACLNGATPSNIFQNASTNSFLSQAITDANNASAAATAKGPGTNLNENPDEATPTGPVIDGLPLIATLPSNAKAANRDALPKLTGEASIALTANNRSATKTEVMASLRFIDRFKTLAGYTARLQDDKCNSHFALCVPGSPKGLRSRAAAAGYRALAFRIRSTSAIAWGF